MSEENYDKLLVQLATLIPQILHINTTIQIQQKQLIFNDKTIICVDLDGTAWLDDREVTQVKLTPAQIAELVKQARDGPIRGLEGTVAIVDEATDGDFRQEYEARFICDDETIKRLGGTIPEE